MGSLQAMEMAELADLDTALAWHLQSNHYPPVPLSMIEPCKQAIDALNEDDPFRWVELPEGVSWRGNHLSQAWAIAEGHHLGAWLDSDEEGLE